MWGVEGDLEMDVGGGGVRGEESRKVRWRTWDDSGEKVEMKVK